MQHLRAGLPVLPGVALHPVIMRGQILAAGPRRSSLERRMTGMLAGWTRLFRQQACGYILPFIERGLTK